MKRAHWFFIGIIVPLLIGAAVVQPGKTIRNYPNKSTLTNTDSFVLEQVTPNTNVHIRYEQILSQVTNGLATVVYVDSVTGGAAVGVFRGSYGDPNGNQNSVGAGIYYDDDGSVWVHGASSGNNSTNWNEIISH